MSRTISDSPLLPCWNEYKRRRRAFCFSLLLLPLWLVPGGTIQQRKRHALHSLPPVSSQVEPIAMLIFEDKQLD
jgi:hypothetical protein